MRRLITGQRIWSIALGWLMLIVASCAFNWHQADMAALDLAKVEARAFFARDLVYRRWASRHGGVYVPTTPETPPNPYLSHVPQRDVVTREGKALTLINPAYMTRQVYELVVDASGNTGTRAHITSLKPLRPENKADAWEDAALRAFEAGAQEVSTQTTINGVPYLRSMHRLITEEPCLRCHAKQGYMLGQVRGGISVSVPLDSYLAVAGEQKSALLWWHALFGVLGLAGLWASSRGVQQAAGELEQSEAMLKTVAESSYDWEYWITPQGALRFTSPSVQRITGYTTEEFAANPALLEEIMVAEDRLVWQRRLGIPGAAGRPTDYTEMDVRLVTRQGGVRWVTCVWRPLINHQGISLGHRMTVRDIGARKQAETALLESETRFNLFMDTLPAAVFIKDADGVVRYCNRFMAHLLGNRVWQGQSTESLFPPEVAERLRVDDRHALETGYTVTEEAIIGADGQSCCYETHKFRILRHGLPPLLGGIALDITERKQIELSLAQEHGQLEDEVAQRTHDLSHARDVAQSANRAKSVFLANMSHELRTPLNAILGLAQIMDRDARLPSEQRKNLATIQRSGQHLLELINDVLEISRIESGQLSSSAAPFDLNEMLDSATESMALRAADKGLRLRVERAPDLPVHVAGDLAKLRQILLNLLSNAVKYTRAGEVLLRVQLARREGNVCELDFSVQDSGVGIEAAELERIFAPFYQATAGIQMGEGTGLGLAISRQYAKLLGGELTATSTPAEGSIFRLVVPVTLAAMTPVPQAQGRVLRLSAGQPAYRVLVAEDEYVNQEVLKMLLEDVGFEVRVADDGKAAVDMARLWSPHFVWMDIRMPVMNGLAATRAIKALPSCAGVPVVALTAEVFEDERKAMFAAGCTDVMIKPLVEERLFSLMEQHLGAHFDREVVPDAVVPTAAADFTALPDTVRLRLRQAAIDLDGDTVRAIADELAAGYPELSRQIIALAYDYRLDRIVQFCSH